MKLAIIPNLIALNRSISQLEDVALQTPGLVFEDYSNGGFGSPTIRGTTQFAIAGLEQNVSTFLDGIYLPRQYATDLGSTNLERIEVVKGPQSALYGANAFAGAINYITTNRSLTEISATAEVEVSDDEGLDISGKVSVPLIDDRLAMRFAIGFSEYDGGWENNFPNAAEVSPGTNGNIGGYDNESLSIGASVRPISALTIDFDYYRFEVSSEAGPQYRLDRTAGDFNCSVGGVEFVGFPVFSFQPGQFQNQLFCGELSADPVAPPGTTDFPDGFVIDPRTFGLESESEIYRTNVALEITDQISANYLFGRATGSVFSSGQTDRNVLTGTANPFVPGLVTSNATTFPSGFYDYDSHELRFEYESDSGIYAMIGGFYSDGDDFDSGIANISLPLPTEPGGSDPVTPASLAGIPTTDALTTTETKAIFARIAIPLMDERLTIELEGRYTDEEKDLVEGALTPFNFTDNYFTPRGSLAFKVTEDNLLYASAARGVKSGGINTALPVGGDESERFFGADTNWIYEIGLKNTFMNGRGTLNLAAFYIDWSNLQLQTAPTGATTLAANIIQNVGGATSKGIELDGAFEVMEGLVVNGGLALIGATYTEGTISGRVTRGNLCGDGTVCNADGDVGGNDLQRSSDFQWNIGASFDTPINDSFDFFSRVDVTGQSKQYVSEINVATIAPRTLTNARIGIRNNNWSASLWAKNLFDKEYISNAFYIGGSPFFSAYVPTAGNRRRIGATLTFDY